MEGKEQGFTTAPEKTMERELRLELAATTKAYPNIYYGK